MPSDFRWHSFLVSAGYLPDTKKLRGKDYIIKQQFINYIELYKRAKVDLTVSHRDDILKFSTLQYFEEYIYLDESNKDTN